eukprot:COSAG01_NODE_452_length_16879_cov_474.367223_3_plen_330_part_00
MGRFTEKSGEQGARCLIGWKVTVRIGDAPSTTSAIVYGVAAAQEAPTKSYSGIFGIGGSKASAPDIAKNRVLVFQPQPASQSVFGPREVVATENGHRRRAVGEYAGRRHKGKYVVYGGEISFKDPNLHFELKRRVSDDELHAACDSAHVARDVASRALKQLPLEDLEARRTYDFELAARLELNSLESKISTGSTDAQRHVVTALVDAADEAGYWSEETAKSLSAYAERLYAEDRARREGSLLREKTTAYESASCFLRQGRNKFVEHDFEGACSLFQVSLFNLLLYNSEKSNSCCCTTAWARRPGPTNRPGSVIVTPRHTPRTIFACANL